MPQTKLNQELRVESLPFRRWLSRIFALFKIKSSGLTKYLLDLIPQENQPHNTCSGAIISIFSWRIDLRKHSVFHFAINEWNKPNFKTCNTESLVSFRKTLSRIGQPLLKSVFNVYNPTGLKLLTRLRLGLSNFDSHRFPDNFSNCVNPLCFCSMFLQFGIRILATLFLHCQFFTNIRSTLLEELAKIDLNILNLCYNSIVDVLLYGSSKYCIN